MRCPCTASTLSAAFDACICSLALSIAQTLLICGNRGLCSAITFTSFTEFFFNVSDRSRSFTRSCLDFWNDNIISCRACALLATLYRYFVKNRIQSIPSSIRRKLLETTDSFSWAWSNCKFYRRWVYHCPLRNSLGKRFCRLVGLFPFMRYILTSVTMRNMASSS